MVRVFVFQGGRRCHSSDATSWHAVPVIFGWRCFIVEIREAALEGQHCANGTCRRTLRRKQRSVVTELRDTWWSLLGVHTRIVDLRVLPVRFHSDCLMISCIPLFTSVDGCDECPKYFSSLYVLALSSCSCVGPNPHSHNIWPISANSVQACSDISVTFLLLCASGEGVASRGIRSVSFLCVFVLTASDLRPHMNHALREVRFSAQTRALRAQAPLKLCVSP